ncbi:MAG: VanZ family protein [Ramlibacter sp.]|uniref:VanZ family protein n=1 Tax=Ramlibacter sp. TaxID=1917967 RepID=UPI0026226E6A|nr:VanZ family protein [Ramlibacter sp.]MDH4375691.1 VanZ family protein [Ramlibacter sp.]
MHKTSAGPLALAYGVLIVYASLYPFDGWRVQGLAPWAFLASPWPQWWTGFDMAANVAGYAPLGFLIALARLRRDPAAGGSGGAMVVSLVAAGTLSFSLEALQTFLPSRVPSNLDLGLNLAGTVLGALLASGLERLGLLQRWSRFRRRWFVDEARGALVLLALWPAGLLFPAPLPLGLGQVLERTQLALAEWLEYTPFIDWLPVREPLQQPLGQGTELVAVALGLLVPCLLAFSIMGALRGRLALMLLLLAAGLAASALSAALSFGPANAWAWLSLSVQLGLAGGLALAVLAVWLPRRGCVALLLPVLVLHLALLNQAPANAYYSLTLQAWEQGRFIRFNGLAQWIGWCWPYAALAYGLLRLSRGDARPRIGA